MEAKTKKAPAKKTDSEKKPAPAAKAKPKTPAKKTAKAPAKKPAAKKPVARIDPPVDPVREVVKTMGRICKAKREDKGFTREVLSDLTGVSVDSIRSFELGKTTPKIDTVIKIADALGYNVDLYAK